MTQNVNYKAKINIKNNVFYNKALKILIQYLYTFHYLNSNDFKNIKQSITLYIIIYNNKIYILIEINYFCVSYKIKNSS